MGDFQGLTESLDYLAGLGISCLWLLPFYPSPNRDNGYDVMDYYNVDPRLGTLGDFVEFMHEAEERGIRVLIDLVVNHTSNQHPWFQAARSDKNSQYREYYVWSEHPTDHDPSLIAFPTEEDSLWEYDEQAEAYYLHHFYKEQPDLNTANPAVQNEIRKIISFWLELGVSGFRIDAAPFLIKDTGIDDARRSELEGFLEELRQYALRCRPDAVLLAEANVKPDRLPYYFGNGNRMDLLFNFIVNQYMFLALARQEAASLWQGLKMLPDIPESGQWLNFARHHDELTLDQLSEAERQEIFSVFAPQENMQIFGRGIRRRLAPMLKGDRKQLELAYSLMFSLPGTPLLRYGDEIGMGDDLALEGRESVRTLMQWSSETNGGFSTAPVDKLAKPVIAEGDYSYQRVNVAHAQRDPNSLLNWMDRLIRLRKQCPEFGQNKWCLLKTDQPHVFAHCCEWKNKAVVALHNLSNQPCTVKLQTDGYEHLMDIFGDQDYSTPDPDEGIVLAEYGYRWLRVNHIY